MYVLHIFVWFHMDVSKSRREIEGVKTSYNVKHAGGGGGRGVRSKMSILHVTSKFQTSNLY